MGLTGFNKGRRVQASKKKAQEPKETKAEVVTEEVTPEVVEEKAQEPKESKKKGK